MKTFAIAGIVLVVLIGAVPSTVAVRAASHPAATSSPRAAPNGDSATAGVRISTSRYGRVEITTAAGATCTLRIEVERGEYGDGPPRLVRGAAGADGALAWIYPAPLVPAGQGRHVVSCTVDQRSVNAAADFDIGATAIDPRGFRVRVQAIDPATGLGGVASRLEPGLVPARDAAVAELNAKLADAWRQATRGLGTLTVVPESADIVVNVVPARGTSGHWRAADGTERVLLYVVDERGRPWTEGGMTAALHELGHIWCCSGLDAAPDRHWGERRSDPLLHGVNQFGLMTDVVVCLVRGPVIACPSQFSGRELAAMGFSDIPAPAPDQCTLRSSELRDELTVLDSHLDASSAWLEATRAELDQQLAREIDSIQRAYPSGALPPDVYATYGALLARRERMLAAFNQRLGAHNTQVGTRNDLAHEINALPC
jgi:hypothetical protein